MNLRLPRLVVVGNGMVGHKLIASLVERGDHARFRIATFCEEPRLAYDRVNLSSYFAGRTAADLSLVARGEYEAAGIEVLVGERAIAIDRRDKIAIGAGGRRVPYDKLVLATGSIPFVPPIRGRDAPGCFVYRTIEDLDAIRAWGRAARSGVVVGGGLLGLEAANALAAMRLETHVVELAPRLMALQVDDAGGALLRSLIEARGVHVHTGKSTVEIATRDGRVDRLRFADGSELETELVVFSAGIRPRDELARAAGLAVGERGGIVVDDRCRTSDPDVYAIGECALHRNKIHGLVAPGYEMARVVASNLTGGDETFIGFDPNTKLKLMGVDVASFGDALATRDDARVMSLFDATTQSYRKLVISADRRRLLGGILVGDASSYVELVEVMRREVDLPPRPEDLLVPARPGAEPRAALPAPATICNCHNVTRQAICDAIGAGRLTSIAEIKQRTRAGTGCGSCVPLLEKLLCAELVRAGAVVTNRLCEHFLYSRQELFHLVRVHGIRSFDDLVARHGTGRGCEVCKPAVASMLATAWNDHVLDRRHAPLQDTNDRFLANLQKDGSYSVVPRVPAGEITPDQLIALGQVAKRFGLYTKITGGQRVDLFGARVEQLPEIWRELVAAGFESGHAYGKALRTVKSCVGTTWCRYGVQDSVSFAIRLEHRYKGLRSPHKIKAAVSGCARECAEAQGKDFGLIATERGYNLFLCGNGGMTPQHARLFATDLDEETVIKYLDRFLMFYVRTADRLQRTASWFNALDGGIEYLRRVIIDDSLGICAELDADMARHVASYRCEWKAALEDPDKLARFRAFVNTDAIDPSIVRIRRRGQPNPGLPPEGAEVEP